MGAACCGVERRMSSRQNLDRKEHKDETIEAKSETKQIERKGDLYTWGDNAKGQIGDSHKNGWFAIPLRCDFFGKRHSIHRFSVGYDHVCVTTLNGDLFGWGSNSTKQLRSNDSIDTINKPCKLKPGMNLIVKDVACGHGFTLIIDESGKVFGRGANSKGQLGNGKPRDVIPEFVRARGIQGASKVCAGLAHSVVLENQEHHMYVFGDNSENQLGVSSDDDMIIHPLRIDYLRPLDADCGDEFTAVITEKGSVKIAGKIGLKSFSGNFTCIDSKNGCQSVASGSSHIVVLTQKGDVRVFGQGWAACCETNTGQKYDETKPVKGLSKVVQVAAGSSHSMALTRDGLLFTWGSDKRGELGLGIETDGKYLPCLVGNIQSKSVDGLINEPTPFFYGIAAGGYNSLAMSDCDLDLDASATEEAFKSRESNLELAKTKETQEKSGILDDEISKSIEQHKGKDESVPEPDSKNMTDEQIKRRKTHIGDISRSKSVISMPDFNEDDNGIGFMDAPPPPPPDS